MEDHVASQRIFVCDYLRLRYNSIPNLPSHNSLEFKDVVLCSPQLRKRSTKICGSSVLLIFMMDVKTCEDYEEQFMKAARVSHDSHAGLLWIGRVLDI